MLTLAAFHGLASVQAIQDPTQALALGGVSSLVPATATRLGVRIEAVWAMPADIAIGALVDTLVELTTADALKQVPPLLERVGQLTAEASAKIRAQHGLPPIADDGETVTAADINAELAKLGEPPMRPTK